MRRAARDDDEAHGRWARSTNRMDTRNLGTMFAPNLLFAQAGRAAGHRDATHAAADAGVVADEDGDAGDDGARSIVCEKVTSAQTAALMARMIEWSGAIFEARCCGGAAVLAAATADPHPLAKQPHAPRPAAPFAAGVG